MFKEANQYSHYHQTKKKIIIIVKVLVFKFRIVKTLTLFLFSTAKKLTKTQIFPPTLSSRVCKLLPKKREKLTQLDLHLKA